MQHTSAQRKTTNRECIIMDASSQSNGTEGTYCNIRIQLNERFKLGKNSALLIHKLKHSLLKTSNKTTLFDCVFIKCKSDCSMTLNGTNNLVDRKYIIIILVVLPPLPQACAI